MATALIGWDVRMDAWRELPRQAAVPEAAEPEAAVTGRHARPPCLAAVTGSATAAERAAAGPVLCRYHRPAGRKRTRAALMCTGRVPMRTAVR